MSNRIRAGQVLLTVAFVCLLALCVECHSVPRKQQAAARRRQSVVRKAAHKVGDPNNRMLERFKDSKVGQLDCLTDRVIPNWDSREARVCDPGVCNGTEALQLMTQPAEVQERFSSQQLQAYLEALGVPKQIEGWMVPIHAWLVGMFSRYQHEHDQYGAVGEIGVYQGKLYLALAGFSLTQEPLMAADWFDAFVSRGYFEGFQKNLQAYVGLTTDDIHLYQGDSNQLTPKWFSERQIPYFRMLSIDASHDLLLVLRDFNLAGCLMIDGGIIIADDFGSTSWMGVNSALYNFVFEQSRVVPFMMVANKLYLTTVSHHEEYFNMLSNLPNVQCKDKQETATQISMGDYRVCFLQHNAVGIANVNGLLQLLTSQDTSIQQ